MTLFYRFIVIILFATLLLNTTCNDDTAPSCELYLEALTELGNEIENLASNSECGEAFECRFLAYGSKPCGGPWRYLIYSTSIDTLLIQDLVAEYNSFEEEYNMNCDAVSDCAAVLPPISFICKHSTCVPVFN